MQKKKKRFSLAIRETYFDKKVNQQGICLIVTVVTKHLYENANIYMNRRARVLFKVTEKEKTPKCSLQPFHLDTINDGHTK